MAMKILVFCSEIETGYRGTKKKEDTIDTKDILLFSHSANSKAKVVN